MYRPAALLALIATLGVTTQMHETRMSIKAAMNHCAGTLGSVHFEGGHMMVLGSTGVNTELSSGGSGGKQKIVFQNQLTRRTAVVTVDGKKGIVWSKNVLKPSTTILCVLPD